MRVNIKLCVWTSHYACKHNTMRVNITHYACEHQPPFFAGILGDFPQKYKNKRPIWQIFVINQALKFKKIWKLLHQYFILRKYILDLLNISIFIPDNSILWFWFLTVKCLKCGICKTLWQKGFQLHCWDGSCRFIFFFIIILTL
jgi:hypothetical protein